MTILVAPGQIWRDPRNPAREVVIAEVSPCTVRVRNRIGGRNGTIKRENFTSTVPERNRWIFVQDAPGERAKLG